jgi:hypothetical protein
MSLDFYIDFKYELVGMMVQNERGILFFHFEIQKSLT